MIRVLFILQQVFSLWMLVDAIRRGCRPYWYLVVLMPFGEWAYFFMVKIHDPEFDWIRAAFQRLTTRKVSVETLRHRADQAPTCAGSLALGHALYDNGQYEEARESFLEARRLDNMEPDALCGIARCQIGLEHYETAIGNLEMLIESEPSFQDYLAWKELAYALSRTDRLDQGVTLLERLVETSPRLEHRVLLANYQVHADLDHRAREQLELGLREFENSPRFLKRRDRAWSRAARKLLKTIG